MQKLILKENSIHEEKIFIEKSLNPRPIPTILFPQPKLPKIMGPRSVFQPFKKKALRESYLEKFRGQVMWSSL